MFVLIEKLETQRMPSFSKKPNDIKGDYYKRYQNMDVKFGYRLPKDRWLRTKPINFLRTHSYLWMTLKKIMALPKKRDRQMHFDALMSTSFEEVIQPTLNSIVKPGDYYESNSIIFGVMMVPRKNGKSVFGKRLKAFFQEEEIAILDLGSKDYGYQEYLSGDGHWNEKGHKKASKFLVPFVEELLENR